MPTKPAPKQPTKSKSAPPPKVDPEKKPSEGRLKEMSLGRRDVRVIKLTECDIMVECNPRTVVTRERINELKAQLRAAAGDDPNSNGQREPARGHMLSSGKFGLTTGKTRHIALSELAKEEDRFGVILVMPEPKGYTDQQRDLDHITSNDGAPLLMQEQATIYKRFKDRDGLTVKQIHDRTGKTEQHIYDCLALLGVAPEVQDAIANGKIAATTVVEITKKVEPELVTSTVTTSIAAAAMEGKSKATNRHVPKSAGGGKSRRKKAKGNDLDAAKKDLEKRETSERMEKATEFQADSVGRLQELLTATIPSRCIRDRRDTVEWMIDYLKGTKSIAQAIDFLSGNEPLI